MIPALALLLVLALVCAAFALFCAVEKIVLKRDQELSREISEAKWWR